jgi:hypothetical protein
MLDRFGSTSPVGRQFIAWCYEHHERYSTIGIVGESFEVWRGLYKEATNLDDQAKTAIVKFASNMSIVKPNAERFLFAVETYLAVLMKLLVAEVSVQKEIVRERSLRGLLGADMTKGYQRLANKITFLHSLFEEDIFDWFLEPAKTSKQASDQAKMHLADIVDALDNLDFKALKTDLIRDLYHGFFDPDTRKALGEFYTKEEIVDELLDFAGYDGKAVEETVHDGGILVDPSCGSGTFLVRAITRWRTQISKFATNPTKAAKLLRTITTNVIGIDIHPFAVAMARVNYLLAIIDLLSPNVVSQLIEVRIPIYWTDSLVMREGTTSPIYKGKYYKPVEVEIPVLGKFVLPRPTDLDWEILAQNVRNGLDSNWSEPRFLEEFPEQARLVYRDLLLELYRWFGERNRVGKDGRWISILTNSVVVHRLLGKCKYVVGNPPWVRIHNVDEAIRDRIQKKFVFYKAGWMPPLRKTRARFKEQYDYCMAFVESGLRLLTENGRLGFVITSKVMQALYAGSMRRYLIDKTKILRIKDYSLSKVQLFKDAVNYPLILVVENALPDIKKDLTHIEVVSHGQIRRWEIRQQELPIIKSDRMSPWMMAPPDAVKAFRKMQIIEQKTGFSTNERIGDVHDVNRGVMTSANDIFLVKEAKPSATSGLMVATTEGEENIIIEEEMLCPFVRGEDISQFAYSPAGYIIWTHDDNGKVLKKLPSNAERYFKSKEKRLAKRDDYKKEMPSWTIFRVSPVKLEQKVGWHELARRMEAVLLPKFQKDRLLGRRRLIPIQTVYFVSMKDAELGKRMAVLLNSTPIRAFISSFAERARGGYFRHISWTVGLIPLPSQLGRLPTNLKDEAKIDAAVARSYQLDSKEVSALKEYYDFVHGS